MCKQISCVQLPIHAITSKTVLLNCCWKWNKDYLLHHRTRLLIPIVHCSLHSFQRFILVALKWTRIWFWMSKVNQQIPIGLLPDTQNCELRMRRECRERFPHPNGLATCITARAWRTYRDACRDQWLAVSFEDGGGETFPAYPAHAQPAILLIL